MEICGSEAPDNPQRFVLALFPLFPPLGPVCLQRWQPEAVGRMCLMYLNGCWSAFAEKHENDEWRGKNATATPLTSDIRCLVQLVQWGADCALALAFCPMHSNFPAPSVYSPWIRGLHRLLPSHLKEAQQQRGYQSSAPPPNLQAPGQPTWSSRWLLGRSQSP